MAQLTLLTGATGILGSDILATLLRETTRRVALIVRAKRGVSAVERIEQLAEVNGTPRNVIRDRVTIFEGDLRCMNFGLGVDAYTHLSKSTTEVIHSAASISLRQSMSAAEEAVFSPLRELIRFTQSSNSLRSFSHVSTVGVGGRSLRILPESLLIQPTEFHNSYEHWKYISEQRLLKDLGSSIRLLIHRPSMIIGSSSSGEISSFQVFYFLSELLTGRLSSGYLPLLKDACLDTVPVNLVSLGVVRLLEHDFGVPTVVHHCSGARRSILYEELARIAQKILGGESSVKQIKSSNEFLAHFDASPREGFFSKESSRVMCEAFLEYLRTSQAFDNTRSRDLLRRVGVPEARANRDVPIALKFFRSHSPLWKEAA